jgi:hypothetical protein
VGNFRKRTNLPSRSTANRVLHCPDASFTSDVTVEDDFISCVLVVLFFSESLWEESEISVLLEAVLSSGSMAFFDETCKSLDSLVSFSRRALEVELSWVLIVLLDFATGRSGV